MSHYSVISQISSTLRTLLTTELATAGVTVSLKHPKGLTADANHQLNLFLYQIKENPFAKNQSRQPIDTNVFNDPPLALNLYYLLTPYVAQNMDNTDEHEILGDAMRVFYDHSILIDELPDILKATAEEIKIVLCPLDLEELTRIWNAMNEPYRLSLCYEVRIVFIDSEISHQVSRVTEKKMHYFEIEQNIS